MSDYLGMLATRYLNQGGSIRPEPVSVYQPPPPDWQLAVDEGPGDEVAFEGPEGAPHVQAEPPAIRLEDEPAPGAQPSPPQPSIRGRDVIAQPPGTDMSSAVPSGQQPPEAIHVPPIPKVEPEAPARDVVPRHPDPPPQAGRETDGPATLARASVAPGRGRAPQAGRETDAPATFARAPVVPYHDPAPPAGREERAAARAAATPNPDAPPQRWSENHPPRPDPRPQGERVNDGLLPETREETTERLPLRVAPSLTIPQMEPGRTAPLEPAAIEPPLKPVLASPPGRGEIERPRMRTTHPPGGRESDIVEISIDEISIRAAPPPPPATPRRDRLVRPPVSLDEYLRRRSAGVRR